MAPIWWSWPKGRIWGQPRIESAAHHVGICAGKIVPKVRFSKNGSGLENLATAYTNFLCSNLDTKDLQMFSLYHNTIFAKLLRLLVHSMSVRGQLYIGGWEVSPMSTMSRDVSIKFLFLLSPPSIARHLLSCWCWSSHWTPTSACSQRFCLLGNLQESGTYTYNDTMMQSDTAETAGCWVIPVGKSQMKRILNNNWRGTILQTTQYRMFTEWIYGKLSLHLLPRSESMILQNLLEFCKN